jgi:KUP system potassium uptake protein
LSAPTSTKSPSALAALTLAALGIVYGDIGTSPLYALKEIFHGGHLATTPDNILGVLSLVFWTLTTVISLKYVLLILRADNKGEGGLIAMLALATHAVRDRPPLRRVLMVVGLFGTAVFYGDGVITPAISVLSAVEGLEVAAPQLHDWVIPLTLLVLTALFAVQRFGTSGIGRWFGPITLVWFGVLVAAGPAAHRGAPRRAGGAEPGLRGVVLRRAAAGGVRGAGRRGAGGHRRRGAVCRPGPLRQAADPHRLVRAGDAGAGGQLLRPGRAASVHARRGGEPVLPDGAALGPPAAGVSRHRRHRHRVAGADLGGVLGHQAGDPAGHPAAHAIHHTSVRDTGQIYIPFINWGLFVFIVLAVVMFKSSSNLASAYGIAVTLDMTITTVMTFFVIRYGWKLSAGAVHATTGFFFVIDVLFFASNLLKLFKGGWFPLVIGIGMFT